MRCPEEGELWTVLETVNFYDSQMLKHTLKPGEPVMVLRVERAFHDRNVINTEILVHGAVRRLAIGLGSIRHFDSE